MENNAIMENIQQKAKKMKALDAQRLAHYNRQNETSRLPKRNVQKKEGFPVIRETLF